MLALQAISDPFLRLCSWSSSPTPIPCSLQALLASSSSVAEVEDKIIAWAAGDALNAGEGGAGKLTSDLSNPAVRVAGPKFVGSTWGQARNLEPSLVPVFCHVVPPLSIFK